MMTFHFLISSALSFYVFATPAKELQTIQRFEVSRSQNPALKLFATKNVDAKVRERAVTAIARIQNPADIDVLVQATRDPEAKVRGTAAWAIGVMALAWQPIAAEQKTKMELALLPLLNGASPELTRTVLTSLGQLGTDSSAKKLREEARSNPLNATAALVGLGLAFRNGAKPEPTDLTWLLPLLSNSDHELRYAGAYALAYAKLPGAQSAFEKLNSDEDPEVQAIARRGLEKLIGKDKPPDLTFWNVWGTDKSQMWQTPDPKLSHALETLTQSKISENEQMHILQHALGLKSVPRVRAAAIGAIGESKNKTWGKLLIPILSQTDLTDVANAYVALAKLGIGSSEKVRRNLMQGAAINPDFGGAIADAAVELKDETVISFLRKLQKSEHVMNRINATAALEKILKTEQTVHWAERHVRKEELELPQFHRAVVHTSKGDIEIELFAEDAPVTTRNFERLAKSGFYRGLDFMRVVPDFVIQGGDPRKDGEGNPGYSIPCEFNQHPYLAGTVGMALSGKDTGGSQFFITLTQQPHLDGRYTVFGQVKKGMDVVQSIREGDGLLGIDVMN